MKHSNKKFTKRYTTALKILLIIIINFINVIYA